MRIFSAIQAENSWIQLLAFGILTIASLILFSLAGQLVVILLYGNPSLQETLKFLSASADQSTLPGEIPAHITSILYITQITSQLGLLVIPPVAFILLMGRSSANLFAWTRQKPAVFTSLLTLALVLLILPFISWLTEMNMRIPLPSALIRAEESAGALVQVFFAGAGTWRFLLNLLMIAIIPAIGEELFFRGIIQHYLIRGLKHPHLAVWLTAILFSFFHFQFQGFIPRILLGLLFGYLMVWTGSVWVPILAHFINNGAAVLVEYLSQRGIIPSGYQDFGTHDGTGSILFSAGISVLICLLIWHYEKKLRSFPPVPGTSPE